MLALKSMKTPTSSTKSTPFQEEHRNNHRRCVKAMATGGVQAPGTDPQQGQVQDVNNEERAPYAGRQMQLSDEEWKVMKECERESFFTRALPLSFGAIVATQALVKSGRLQGNPKYGALPKAIFLGGVGYITGKLMYLPKCQEKILQKIPNSNLAASVRKAKGLPQPDESQTPAEYPGSSSSPNSKLREEYSTPSAGLDERFRPTMDRDVKPEEAPVESKPRMSYEELRRRNRQQHEESTAKRPPPPSESPNYKDNPIMPQKPFPEERQAPPPPPPRSEQPQRKKRTNIWGDVIDE